MRHGQRNQSAVVTAPSRIAAPEVLIPDQAKTRESLGTGRSAPALPTCRGRIFARTPSTVLKSQISTNARAWLRPNGRTANMRPKPSMAGNRPGNKCLIRWESRFMRS